MSTFTTEMYSLNRSYYRLLTLGVDIILTNNQQILNLFNFCCMKLSLIAFTGMRDCWQFFLFWILSYRRGAMSPECTTFNFRNVLPNGVFLVFIHFYNNKHSSFSDLFWFDVRHNQCTSFGHDGARFQSMKDERDDVRCQNTYFI